ncbi:Protein kinase domain [Dillenia turbinata]|uniref:non-specific serine/threonine protein kinase n=1 Tax=Dillenia turbinata TaxID=194707 RepID=A0AAN8VPI7_9MAGN
MWRFNPFTQKEQTGLEGRIIDIGNLKVQIRNAVAEGGFSCVYFGRDAMHPAKQYAVKHIICNGEESLELVMKEISVMKSLKGHPNVVTLYAHSIFDMGRTKEAFLVMEFCEKSLVNVLENRGAGFFEEKQVLSIFRDVCNAVFAMHCQNPPIAHRDLKAENLLLGSDGLWKLCDFGSISTNHKRFERPEEMGIEEDNIRKYTTPAYRAPEMWDLFRRDLINEKVDIWALGCLLFRICYFKSAFDGESKLQILNGNYRIPELPKYSTSVTDLIRDMLQGSPDARPDITQASALLDWPFISMSLGTNTLFVWFRVNDLLPVELQKSLPDQPPEMHQSAADSHDAGSKSVNKGSPMPRRSPPPPPSSSEPPQNPSPPLHVSRAGSSGGALGAFWSSQYAKDSVVEEDKPKFDDKPPIRSTPDHRHPEKDPYPRNINISKEENNQSHPVKKMAQGRPLNRTEDGQFELKFFQDHYQNNERAKNSKPESKPPFQKDAFPAFVAEFDTSKLSSQVNNKSAKEETLAAEVERLKDQLRQANLEKAEITSKFEKLSAICRSQRQEIQELKQAVAARTLSSGGDTSKVLPSLGTQQSSPPLREKIGGAMCNQQHGLFDKSSPSPDSKPWQAFAEDPKPVQPLSKENSNCVRTRNSHQNKHASEGASKTMAWGFETDSFTAMPSANSHLSRPIGERSSPQHFGEFMTTESKANPQPAGWAGF